MGTSIPQENPAAGGGSVSGEGASGFTRPQKMQQGGRCLFGAMLCQSCHLQKQVWVCFFIFYFFIFFPKFDEDAVLANAKLYAFGPNLVGLREVCSSFRSTDTINSDTSEMKHVAFSS